MITVNPRELIGLDAVMNTLLEYREGRDGVYEQLMFC